MPELNIAVKIQAPKTLLQVYKISRLQEETFGAQASSLGFISLHKWGNTILPTPTTLRISGYQKNTISQPVVTKPKIFRRFTAAEMNAKSVKGLCFLFDDKYVVGHNCGAYNNYYGRTDR